MSKLSMYQSNQIKPNQNKRKQNMSTSTTANQQLEKETTKPKMQRPPLIRVYHGLYTLINNSKSYTESYQIGSEETQLKINFRELSVKIWQRLDIEPTEFWYVGTPDAYFVRGTHEECQAWFDKNKRPVQVYKIPLTNGLEYLNIVTNPGYLQLMEFFKNNTESYKIETTCAKRTTEESSVKSCTVSVTVINGNRIPYTITSSFTSRSVYMSTLLALTRALNIDFHRTITTPLSGSVK